MVPENFENLDHEWAKRLEKYADRKIPAEVSAEFNRDVLDAIKRLKPAGMFPFGAIVPVFAFAVAAGFGFFFLIQMLNTPAPLAERARKALLEPVRILSVEEQRGHVRQIVTETLQEPVEAEKPVVISAPAVLQRLAEEVSPPSPEMQVPQEVVSAEGAGPYVIETQAQLEDEIEILRSLGVWTEEDDEEIGIPAEESLLDLNWMLDDEAGVMGGGHQMTLPS
ncbi:MAG: hypothetical protein A2Z83_08035 [Omnitrophica bacterium GWA2_52_8]|nr:MAG: hypothetical protein A2Z83_08035 [Omnitrophica bacterium GWA2_52_8]